MKQIIVIKPKSISAKDKEKLSKNGFVVIESEKSEDIKVLAFGESLMTPNDILMAALKGVEAGAGTRSFFEELYKRIKQNEQTNKTT